MSAYLIVLREGPVRDQAAMAEYGRVLTSSAEASGTSFGMVPVVVYGAIEALEGAPADGAVILRFPTMAKAREWYDSAEYRAALEWRKQAADWRVMLVEGFDPARAAG